MDRVTYGFLLTTLAGLSTMIGSLFIFFSTDKKDRVIVKALSFAAGVMITVSLTDLIPEGKELLLSYFYPLPALLIVLIFIVMGIIVSMLIDKFLPDNNIFSKSTQHKTLYRVGIISMLAIILHNIPEGIATFIATNKDMSLGISLTLAIALHNIPEGISISIPLFYATGSKRRAFLYTFMSGISELFGAVLAFLFLGPIMNNFMMGILFSIIAGIMLHISFYELLPTAKSYNKPIIMWLFFLIGISFMLLNHFCLS